MKKILLLIMIFIFSLCWTFAGWNTIPEISENADLEKDFDSPIWDSAFKTDDFKVPVEETLELPQEDTEVKIVYDGDKLLIQIRCEDKNISEIHAGSAPVDGLLNKFPIGDHVELVINSNKKYILAFDCNGNKYLSIDYAPAKYCSYQLTTRKTGEGWDAIVSIKISELFSLSHKKKKDISFQAVRHIDHGKGLERSFATGRNMLDIFRFHVGGEEGGE